MIDLKNKPYLDSKCIVSLSNDSWIWYKRFAHASMNLIDKLFKNNLVVSLPILKYVKDRICNAC